MHVASVDAQDRNTFDFQPSIAARIVTDAACLLVRAAVDLHTETYGITIEVQNIRTERMLPAKTQSAGLPPPQELPEPNFRG